MTKITRKILAEAVGCDDIQHNRKDDTWTFRRGFFYTNGFTADKWMAKVGAQLKQAGLGPFLMMDRGEVWKAFNGGAPIRRQSHWYVVVAFTADVPRDDLQKARDNLHLQQA